MFSKGLMKDFNPQRLKSLLVVFFLALAIPTGVLIWQAYNQLKWEAFYQHRNMAEELTNRIDVSLNDKLNTVEARSFTDYAFLVVSGDPAANFLQRSPLSTYPVTQDMPGVVGYFQVGAKGEFSTPLLPEPGTSPQAVGISQAEFAQRTQLAQEIQQVLAKNQQVRSRLDAGRRRAVTATPAFPATTFEAEVDKDRTDRFTIAPVKQSAANNEDYSQQIFDQLNQPRDLWQANTAIGSITGFDDELGEASMEEQRSSAKSKVADLKLDAVLQKKSEVPVRKELLPQAPASGRGILPVRAKRIEQSALPEAIQPQTAEEAGGKAGLADLRISTFESEVDPFEFSLLDSGHLVLFRKVWRNGERQIQGLLIDQQRFLNAVIVETFRSTALSAMSTLAVAYQDKVIATIAGRMNSSYPASAAQLDGTLLYQSHLAAPLGGLQLIFSIDRLPPGPGARVLAWTTMVIALVFLGGFYALYRMGLSQINLARQQQDFVSAVSHELKTPLTSIRMYGEMLKEGWADEAKRQQYYGYIHDEAERLTRLISNVLQLAKITRNEPQFDMKPHPVSELMSQIESKIINQVESAGFELAFERDPDTDKATIEIDDDCFAQIVINLVDNAIKFSRDAARKRIEIRCTTSRDNTVTFAVRDYGPGVPKNQMKKIFKLFYRSESELTRETVGTGIGLAIVHQLATAMNGTVDVVNRDPGVEFKLSFSLV